MSTVLFSPSSLSWVNQHTGKKKESAGLQIIQAKYGPCSHVQTSFNFSDQFSAIAQNGQSERTCLSENKTSKKSIEFFWEIWWQDNYFQILASFRELIHLNIAMIKSEDMSLFCVPLGKKKTVN